LLIVFIDASFYFVLSFSLFSIYWLFLSTRCSEHPFADEMEASPWGLSTNKNNHENNNKQHEDKNKGKPPVLTASTHKSSGKASEGC